MWMLMVACALLVAGCTIGGPVGEYQGSFHCKGKGNVSGSGALSLGAGVGGSGTNAWNIQADCGDGLTIERDRVRTQPAPKP